MRQHKSGVIDYDGAIISYEQIIGGLYTLCITSDVKSIVSPVESRLQAINNDSSRLILMCISVAVFLFFVVLIIVFTTSKSIADPLRETADEAKQISLRLGDDLLGAVHPKRAMACGAREVSTLRRDFVVMLDDMMQLRLSRGQLPPVQNPFFQEQELSQRLQGFDDELCHRLNEVRNDRRARVNDEAEPQAVAAQQIKATQPSDEVLFEKLMPLRKFLLVWIVVPVVLGLALVLVTASVGVSVSMKSWSPAIRDKILEDEKANIVVRTETLQDLTASLFARAAQSASLLKEYSEMVWNAGHGLDPSLNLTKTGSPYRLYHDRNGPIKMSPWTDTPDGGVGSSARFPTMPVWNNNMRFMVVYDNARSAAKGESGYAAPFSTSEWTNKVVPQQTLLSHVDNAARAIYLSNELVVQLYIAVEETETFRMFPYRDMTSYYNSSYFCVANNLTLVSYSPVCRSWYQNAKSNGGNITFNPIALGAATGLALLPISFGLQDANGRFFGAGAIDLSVNTLRDFVNSMVLYQHGYVYVMDRNGYAVMHKDLVVTLSQTIESLEYECASQTELDTFHTSILPQLKKGQSSEGVVSHERCGQTWLSVWRPVNGTPYMFVATVPFKDIVKPADDFVHESKAILAGFETGFAVLWFMCSVGCVWFVRRFTLTISAPVVALAGFVRKMHTSSYSVDTPKITPNCLELALIQSGIDDLLTALRFSNPQYSRGSLIKELANFMQAKIIVERNEYRRGTGIVYNNIGNTMRQLQTKVGIAAFSQFSAQLQDKDARWFLERSVEIAQDLVQVGDGQEEDKQALSQRLFNLGVYFLSVDDLASAEVQFNLCLITAISGSGAHVSDVLVRYAYSLALLNVPSVLQHTVRPQAAPAFINSDLADDAPAVAPAQATTPARQLAQRFVDSALEPGRLLTPAAIPMLCFVCGLLKEDPRFWLWALVNLQEMGVFYLSRLAAFVKAEDLSLLSVVDRVMSAVQYVQWVTGQVLPERAFFIQLPGTRVSTSKTLLFCLDISGSMTGARLQQCKEALLMIFNDHCTDLDNIGLVTFSANVNTNQTIATRGQCRSQILAQISTLESTGGTAFYRALQVCLEQLRTVPREPKWLVALTDGDDNQSPSQSFQHVITSLSSPTSSVNLAVITVGTTFAVNTTNNIHSLITATQRGSHTAHHISAENTHEIQSAFQTVVGLIDDSLAFTEYL
eukprot:c5384_g1_i1.p1 GENE.c5384_g1_i1~~c5384_g1_i1.p1  ORF type:complete len:1201 (-),score=319.04 c5384_g1_i1:200-3802(-)